MTNHHIVTSVLVVHHLTETVMESIGLPLLITAAAVGVLALLGVLVLVIIGFILLERTSRIEQMNYRLENVEDYLRDLSSTVNEAQSGGEEGTPMFRSIDGKYAASSLEELIAMMQADPESELNKGGDSSENLKKFFDQLSDNDDDEQEPWKKKKD